MKENVQLQRISLVLVFSSKIMLSVHCFFLPLCLDLLESSLSQVGSMFKCKMQAGTTYTDKHNWVAGIVYRNICVEYGLELPKSQWKTPLKVVQQEN